LCFLAVCLAVLVLVVVAGAGVAVSAAIGAAVFGMSAAMEAAAKPKVNKAVVMRVADFFMRSPNGWLRLKRCEEYDGLMRYNRDEDHFTLTVRALGTGRFFVRTCHTR
jgi:hypothetical protein